MTTGAATAERTEAEMMWLLQAGAPAPVLTALGMAATRMGGGVVLAMRNDPVQYWNKALGFGFDEPVTSGLVAEVCGFYRAHGVPLAVLQFAPSVLPADWDDIRDAHGLEVGGAIVKLAHDLESIPEAPTDLRVVEIEPRDATTWAGVSLDGFGMPRGDLQDLFAALVGRCHCFAAWDGPEMVGVGALVVHADGASVVGGATLASHRRRGAHSALLASRLRAARAAGCGVAVVETGVESPGQRNQSLHNLRRAGFTPLYERRDWIWRP